MTDLVDVIAEAMNTTSSVGEWGEYPPFNRFARLALSAIEQAGYRVVPVNPDYSMLLAGGDELECNYGVPSGTENMWTAMLKAAPKLTP
jgi:hypothetical protein